MKKPINSSTPDFKGPKSNRSLNEYLNVTTNSLHQSRVSRAEGVKQPKTKFKAPKDPTGPGNPWLNMEKDKK